MATTTAVIYERRDRFLGGGKFEVRGARVSGVTPWDLIGYAETEIEAETKAQKFLEALPSGAVQVTQIVAFAWR